MSNDYQFADLCLRSDVALPELMHYVGTPSQVLTVQAECFERSTTSDPDPSAVVSGPDIEQTDSDAITIMVNESIRFEVASSFEHVIARRSCDVADEAIRPQLLGHVLPRVLAARGGFSLRAAGTRLPSGGVALFAGPSGTGKSSIAASFDIAGAEALGDDCFAVFADADGLTAQSTHPSIQVHKDTFEYFYGPGTDTPSVIKSNGKLQLAPQHQPARSAREPVVAIFILDSSDGHQGAPTLHPLSAMQATVALLRNSFRFDDRSRSGLNEAFDRAIAITDRVTVYSLRYERQFGVLEDVRALIEQLEPLGTT